MRSITTASVFALLTALSGTVCGAEDVKVNLEVHLVQVDTNGREVLRPANQASPGDILEYKVTCKNQGDSIARDVRATLPVPVKGLLFLEKQSEVKNIQASVDGNRFASLPLQKYITTPDGFIKTTVVDPIDYRFLRWNVGDLPAQGSKTVYARMRLVTANQITVEVQP